MKYAIATVLLASSLSAIAGDNNLLETTDEARQRQSAENYDTYRKQDNPLLPPSYQRPLGDASVQGVERPGYISPQPTYQQPSYGRSWQDRAKGR